MRLQSAAFFAFALILLLFLVAAFVERQGGRISRSPKRGPVLRRYAYTLALGVYCSSWTFYGAVGSAVREGWNFLPIYLAPICLLIAAPRFLKRLARSVADEQATTVSDFIAARFGHDIIVARLVTIIALAGTLPYVALQFRSIGAALSIVSDREVMVPAMICAAALLALFAILFGARRFELAGRSEGLLYAIGLESIIKIVALVSVAIVAVTLIGQASPIDLDRGIALLGTNFRPENLSLEVGIIFLISTMAILVLPRQFYMGLVEAREPGDLARARFGLAAYMAVMALMILPIALAGATVLNGSVAPDLYVLQLPASSGHRWVLVLALLGGVSAAASMVIVDSTALATMVSNDLIFPTVLGGKGHVGDGAIGRRMLLVRRLSIIGIVMLALAWALLVSPLQSLASIGLVAFAAMAQFTPHLLLATYAGGRDALAARASLSVGFILWSYTLALPPILPESVLRNLAGGLFDPLRLFGIGDASQIVHGTLWSLGANLAVYGLVAARKVKAPLLPRLLRGQRQVSDLSDLAQLTASFVGEERVAREFPSARRGMAIDRKSAQRARELIGRVVGASSARTLVASALAGGQMNLADVTRLLDEGGQSLRFSRQLLGATFENIDAGISVVDADMNLIAWNSQYMEIFGYPPGLVRVGAPISELIRYNGRVGDFGSEDIEFHVEKRLGHMRRGVAHSFERRRSDGRVIKTVGGPMPSGGYVTSFTDITEEAHTRDELSRTLAELESRVADRTQELSAANLRLARATQDKTRFLAAASHDLLQPLHAARLFTSALQRDVDAAVQPLVGRVESAILAAEALLRALLDISRLDAGGMQPDPEPIALAPFLTDIAETFRPLADEKGLRLRIGPLSGTIHSDPALLRSVVQNFLSNAIRYTTHGGVLLAVRRRGGMMRLDVIDSGVGIAPDQIDTIFGEFTRLGEVEVEGLGLGLALVERIARILGGTVEVRSTPGRGSRFSLLLPATSLSNLHEDRPPAPSSTAPVRSLRVLVVDNDPMIVEASIALLTSLGHRPVIARNSASALPLAGTVDAALVDYRLDGGEDGLTLIAALHVRNPTLPMLLVTAEASPDLARRAGAQGVAILAKPAAPQAIAAFLAQVSASL